VLEIGRLFRELHMLVLLVASVIVAIITTEIMTIVTIIIIIIIITIGMITGVLMVVVMMVMIIVCVGRRGACGVGVLVRRLAFDEFHRFAQIRAHHIERGHDCGRSKAVGNE